MSNGGGHRILIGVCHIVEDMDTDWCMSNGGGHRMLSGVCHMVEDMDTCLLYTSPSPRDS